MGGSGVVTPLIPLTDGEGDIFEDFGGGVNLMNGGSKLGYSGTPSTGNIPAMFSAGANQAPLSALILKTGQNEINAENSSVGNKMCIFPSKYDADEDTIDTVQIDGSKIKGLYNGAKVSCFDADYDITRADIYYIPEQIDDGTLYTEEIYAQHIGYVTAGQSYALTEAINESQVGYVLTIDKKREGQ